MKRTGKSKKNGKQYTYYCCEKLTSKNEAEKCDFMTWDVPVADDCPVCGQTMFKKAGKGFKRPFCINEQCSNFTPEEKRGGWKKKETPAEGEPAPAQGAEKPKKAAAKKTTAKKETVKKETAAKKEAVKATFHLQFAGKAYTTDELVKIAMDVWKYDLDQKESDFKTVELYVKPEENVVYYVINGEVTGNFGI